nr:hypothetical protein [Tanacetum cinerariifolium]
MFWHTARDDSMFNTIRVISRHHDTPVYGVVLPAALTNQKMLDCKAYKEYYAVAYGAEPPKAKIKYKKKADKSVTFPKSKTASASKEVRQIKLVTKRSKIYFHISKESGLGDGVDSQSKVPDEQQQKTSGTDEGTGTIPRVPDVPPYESKSDKDDGISNPNLTNVDQTEYKEEEVDEEKINDEETIDDEEYDEVFKELYEDVNVNLEKGDAEMTDANQRGSEQQNKADEPVQSSSISFEFTSKFLNLENPSLADNEIASLMETSTHHATAILEITFGFSTNTPPPPLVASQSKFKLKKILIDEMEANKSINKSDTQKNLCNALVESYNSNKDIITSYGDVVLLKRGRDDQDKDEDPSTGSNRGTKRMKSSKDAKTSKDLRSKEKKSSSTSTDASQSQYKSFRKSIHAEEPSHTIEESSMHQDKDFMIADNDEQPVDKEVTKAD